MATPTKEWLDTLTDEQRRKLVDDMLTEGVPELEALLEAGLRRFSRGADQVVVHFSTPAPGESHFRARLIQEAESRVRFITYADHPELGQLLDPPRRRRTTDG